jgi:hypothetical protein
VLFSKQRIRPGDRPAAQAELALALLKVESAAMAARTAQAELALALLKARHAKLVAAARASVTAARAGAADPLAYVRAELSRYDGLPPLDSTVPRVLADAGAAMTLAGRAAGPASWQCPGDLAGAGAAMRPRRPRPGTALSIRPQRSGSSAPTG